MGENDVLEHLFELSVLLGEAIERGMSESGLTRSRAELIWRLLHRGPTTQRELSQMLRCTARNITGLVDALQTDGFVMRSPHPTDRRATLVELTEKGKKASEAWWSGYLRTGSRLFDRIGSADLSRFSEVLNIVLQRLRDEAEGNVQEPT